MDTENPNLIIDRLGGTSETARLCEVKPPSVSEWRHKGIPKTQLKFLKAVRPDVFEDAPLTTDEPDRPRRNLPDGKNVMSVSTDQPATFEVKK
jgi:hypothetical protein